MPIPGGSRATRKLSFVGRISIDKALVLTRQATFRVLGHSQVIVRPTLSRRGNIERCGESIPT
jgi:hypothetical protein